MHSTPANLDRPAKIPIIGGAAASPRDGATRKSQDIGTGNRVFGYRSFYVCDGSVITANVGGAPTLTITALAERCMASIPPRTA